METTEGLMGQHRSADLEGRLARLKQMLAIDPTNERLKAQCVETAVSAGDFEYILGLSDALLADRPGDPHALFDKATALIGRRDYQAAIAVLTSLIDVRPEYAVHFNLGLCQYCIGHYQDARPHLEHCYEAEADASRASLVRLLMSTYHHLGLLENAVKVAQENAGLGNSDATLAGVYALLFLDAGDATLAARWAAATLRMNPKSVDGRVTQATLLTGRMQVDQSQAMFNSVLADAPNTARAWIGLGTLSLLEQQLPRAEQQLKRGLELMPGHVGSWHVLGWTQLVSGDLTGAENTFQHALELDRNFAETHGALGSLAAMRGDRALAQQFIEVALRLDRGSLSAKFAQAILMGKAGDPETARKIILDTTSGLAAKDGSALSKLLLRKSRPS